MDLLGAMLQQVDFPRPNLPLHVRLLNEFLLRVALPWVPDVAK
jgi:hypothetical protein